MEQSSQREWNKQIADTIWRLSLWDFLFSHLSLTVIRNSKSETFRNARTSTVVCQDDPENKMPQTAKLSSSTTVIIATGFAHLDIKIWADILKSHPAEAPERSSPRPRVETTPNLFNECWASQQRSGPTCVWTIILKPCFKKSLRVHFIHGLWILYMRRVHLDTLQCSGARLPPVCFSEFWVLWATCLWNELLHWPLVLIPSSIWN